ncbi:hypothetical protein ACI75Y_04915 [Capnocytophaga stomatis]|uniref:hypothetical protein n=1 Tax=Capnocytophaga stomatis TaxID=1848904 RepID=UPI00385B9BE3
MIFSCITKTQAKTEPNYAYYQLFINQLIRNFSFYKTNHFSFLKECCLFHIANHNVRAYAIRPYVGYTTYGRKIFRPYTDAVYSILQITMYGRIAIRSYVGRTTYRRKIFRSYTGVVYSVLKIAMYGRKIFRPYVGHVIYGRNVFRPYTDAVCSVLRITM